MDTEQLRALLIRHEGLRLKPYRDTEGKMTIGVGRNLDDVGITVREAQMLLDTDIGVAKDAAFGAFPWLLELDLARQTVVVNMVFNLGLPRFRGFKKLIAAIEKRDFELAAAEMLDSKWATQVKGRALELASIMRTGVLSRDA